MGIEADLFTRLNDSTITAYTGDRVYPVDPNENTSWPFITYRADLTESVGSMAGNTGAAVYSVQIDVWAQSVAQRVAIVNAVKARLDYYRGGNVQLIRYQSEQAEELGTEEEGDIYHSALTFAVYYWTANVSSSPDPGAGTILTGPDGITLTACSHSLVLDCTGLHLDGAAITTGGPYQPLAANLTGLANMTTGGALYRYTIGGVPIYSTVLGINSITSGISGINWQIGVNSATGIRSYQLILQNQTNALNALLPDQTGNGSKVLGTDGTNAAWVAQTGGGGGGAAGFGFEFTYDYSLSTTGAIRFISGVGGIDFAKQDKDGNALPAALDAWFPNGGVCWLWDKSNPANYWVGQFASVNNAAVYTLYANGTPATGGTVTTMNSFTGTVVMQLAPVMPGPTGASGANGSDGAPGVPGQVPALRYNYAPSTSVGSGEAYWDSGNSEMYLSTYDVDGRDVSGVLMPIFATGGGIVYLCKRTDAANFVNAVVTGIVGITPYVYKLSLSYTNPAGTITTGDPLNLLCFANGTQGPAGATGTSVDIQFNPSYNQNPTMYGYYGSTDCSLFMDTSTGTLWRWSTSSANWVYYVNLMGPAGAAGLSTVDNGTSSNMSGMVYGNGSALYSDPAITTNGSGALTVGALSCGPITLDSGMGDISTSGRIATTGTFSWNGYDGVNGSFYTADGKTVTVTGGIITSIV